MSSADTQVAVSEAVSEPIAPVPVKSKRSTKTATKKKKAKVPTFEQALAILRAGKWSCSKVKENKNKGGHSIYPRNDTVAGGPMPNWIQPRAPIPWKPDYGKFKADINKWTNMDMEMSVRDTPEGRLVVEFFGLVDAWVRATVGACSEEIYHKTLSPAEMEFRHRASLQPNKKTGGFPYLLRIKVHPNNTKFYQVIGVNAEGKNVCRRASIDDMCDWCEVLPSVDYTGIYASGQGFGSTYFARKVMFWEPQKRRQEEEDPDDNSVGDMGDDFAVISEDEDDDDAAAAAAGAGAGAGDGGGGGDREPSNKRMRTVPVDEKAPDDDAYANSGEEDE